MAGLAVRRAGANDVHSHVYLCFDLEQKKERDLSLQNIPQLFVLHAPFLQITAVASFMPRIYPSQAGEKPW